MVCNVCGSMGTVIDEVEAGTMSNVLKIDGKEYVYTVCRFCKGKKND